MAVKVAVKQRFSVRVETWTIRKSKSGEPVYRAKIAVRDQFGRFHGATNFKQKV